MRIRFSTAALHETRWQHYAVRFVFGGAITAIAGVIAKEFGPAVGGLFLAFPAIFPAAATLAESHEREKKQQHGMPPGVRGTLIAGIQAYGTALGSIGLAVFAVLFWTLATRMTLWLLFPLAVVSWFSVAAVLWLLRRRIPLLRDLRPRGQKMATPRLPRGVGE